MKKIFKKNQIMIVALALMIAVAGYLNFAGTNATEEVASLDDNTVMDEDGVALLDLSEEDIASLDSEYVEISDQYSDVVMEMEGKEVEEEAPAAEVAAEETTGESVDTQLGDNQLLSENEAVIDEVPGEAVFTSSGAISNLADAKLLKEQTRARNKENLLDIINNENLMLCELPKSSVPNRHFLIFACTSEPSGANSCGIVVICD